MLLALASAPGHAASPLLEVPVACPLDSRCAIQKYVDLAAGPARADYRCGLLTTDAHDGTDFRLRRYADFAESAPVIAAAPGTVVRLRDGMQDRMADAAGVKALGSRLAGNAVVIAHGDGWETQYSHLKRGSVRVAVGQAVVKGDMLGLIGMSGAAEFPHVHFEVRHNGSPIDPFSGKGLDGGCDKGPSVGLWSTASLGQMKYRATTVLAAGFTSDVATITRERTGLAPQKATVDRGSPMLVLWVDIAGARPGDVQIFRIMDPKGDMILERVSRVAKGGLSWVAYAGLRAPPGGWKNGKYTGVFSLTRENKTTEEIREYIEIN